MPRRVLPSEGSHAEQRMQVLGFLRDWAEKVHGRTLEEWGGDLQEWVSRQQIGEALGDVQADINYLLGRRLVVRSREDHGFVRLTLRGFRWLRVGEPTQSEGRSRTSIASGAEAK